MNNLQSKTIYTVAKIGWSYPKGYDCTDTHWRRHLRYLAKWMLITVLALMFSSAIVCYMA